MRQADRLVAHRGEMSRACENTLPAFRAALHAGARYVELDVQFTRDGVPMVCHDASLKRLTGHDVRIMELDARTLTGFYARDRRWRARIPRLEQVVPLFNRHPHTTLFVELKRASIQRFGLVTTSRGIARAMNRARFRWVLISFDADAVGYARRQLHVPTGWVLPAHNAQHRARADELRPEYLFVDGAQVSANAQFAWPGAWQWVIYDIPDWGQAKAWFARGAHLIETGRISDMLSAARDNDR